ncbi:MAG: LamG domain-containing protein [archaeon]
MEKNRLLILMIFILFIGISFVSAELNLESNSKQTLSGTIGDNFKLEKNQEIQFGDIPLQIKLNDIQIPKCTKFKTSTTGYTIHSSNPIQGKAISGEVYSSIESTAEIAKWHMDEGSGNTINDASENNNDGTISGATWVDGISGKALSFNGNGYVDISSSINQAATGTYEYTLQAWVYLEQAPASGAVILEKWLGGQGGSWILSIQSDLKPSLDWGVFMTRGGPTGLGAKSDSPILLNQWNYIAATVSYNSATDTSTAKVYVNGEKTGEFESVVDAGKPIDYTTGVTIGANRIDDGSPSNYFKGKMDEVAVYNRALSAEEIKQTYDTLAPITNQSGIVNDTVNITDPVSNQTIINETINETLKCIDGNPIAILQVKYSQEGKEKTEVVKLQLKENKAVFDFTIRFLEFYASNNSGVFVVSMGNKTLSCPKDCKCDKNYSIIECKTTKKCPENTLLCPDGECKEICEITDVTNNATNNCQFGCLYQEKCLPIGIRDESLYCSLNGTMQPQVIYKDKCDNSFECKSNLCIDGNCISSSFIQRILDWLMKFFGK